MSQTLNACHGIKSVHPYEESARIKQQGFVDDIHRRIKEDLSTFGEVVSILGEITVTRRHGIIFSGVKAKVRHPRIRMLMLITVEWTSETNSLSYRNEYGNPLRLDPQSWNNRDPLSARERELVEEIMTRLDNHEVWSSWGPRLTASKRIRLLANTTGGSFGAATIFAGEVALGASPVLAAATMMIAGTFGGCFMGEKVVTARSDRRAQKINAVVEKWNEDRAGAFNSLFTSSEEKAEFIDALLTLCDSTGVLRYNSGLQASRAPLRRVITARDHHELIDAEVERHQKDDTLIMTSVLEFQGSLLEGGMDFLGGRSVYTEGYFYFDGRHFYSYANEPFDLVTPIA